MKYLSSSIGNDYKDWKGQDRILLCAQTGAGKTTFILHQLLPFIVHRYVDIRKKAWPYPTSDGKPDKIIYLCNRTSLYEQLCSEVDRSFESIFDDLSLSDSQFFPPKEAIIELYTYQSLEQKMTNSLCPFINDAYGRLFVVFDELHYLTDDAEFNTSTVFWEKAFNVIAKQSNVVSIYITATPEELLPLIGENSFSLSQLKRNHESVEIAWGHSYESFDNLAATDGRILNSLVTWMQEKQRTPLSMANKLKIYPKPENNKPYQPTYSYLVPHHFNDWEKLGELICQKCNSSGEKWLIFVDKKETGRHLKSTLFSNGIKCEFIAAETKRTKKSTAREELERIQKNACFDSQVLISTSVLFNGVNIKDALVTNIVIPYLEKVKFLQSLGRIRIDYDAKPKINLFVWRTSFQRVHSYVREKRKMLLELIRFYNLQQSDFVWPNESHNGFPNINSVYHISPITKDRIVSQLASNKDLLSHYAIPETDQGRSSKKELAKDNIDVPFFEFRINKFAFFHLLYTYVDYKNMLDEYRQFCNRFTADSIVKRNFFYAQQLKWIGMYDETALETAPIVQTGAFYAKGCNDLTELFDEYQGEAIEKNAQLELRRKLYSILSVLSPSVFDKDSSRYQNGQMIPGKSRLNVALEDFGMRIESQVENRKTVWYLKRIIQSD